MVLTEEELELEKTLSKSMKAKNQCTTSTSSFSKSSCSGIRQLSRHRDRFLKNSFKQTILDNDIARSSTTEDYDGINELYLEMTPLQTYSTEPWGNRRKVSFGGSLAAKYKDKNIYVQAVFYSCYFIRNSHFSERLYCRMRHGRNILHPPINSQTPNSRTPCVRMRYQTN